MSPAGVAELVRDADAVAPRAHPSGGQGTVYLEFPDFSLPEGHPRLHFADYGCVPSPTTSCRSDSPLRRLYEWDPLKDLVEAVLDRGPIYPLRRSLRRAQPGRHGRGDLLQWHFDQTDFVVSLAIQSAESGRRLRGRAPHPQRRVTSATTRSRPFSAAIAPGSRRCPMTTGHAARLRRSPLAPPGEPHREATASPRRAARL